MSRLTFVSWHFRGKWAVALLFLGISTGNGQSHFCFWAFPREMKRHKRGSTHFPKKSPSDRFVCVFFEKRAMPVERMGAFWYTQHYENITDTIQNASRSSCRSCYQKPSVYDSRRFNPKTRKRSLHLYAARFEGISQSRKHHQRRTQRFRRARV